MILATPELAGHADDCPGLDFNCYDWIVAYSQGQRDALERDVHGDRNLYAIGRANAIRGDVLAACSHHRSTP